MAITFSRGIGITGNIIVTTTPTSPPPPVANFTATPLSGQQPLTVNFTDTSTGSPTSWAWDFTNNGSTDSTLQNPSYVYSNAGTYSVKLTATNAAGSDDEIKTNYIIVTNNIVDSGQILYDTPGNYSWTAPTGVTSVDVVCIGGGGAGTRGTSPSDVNQLRRGGGGGGLGWKNNIPVTPGQTYTVVVGAGGNALATGNIISTSSSNVQVVNSGSVTFALDSPTTFVVNNKIKASPMANPAYFMLGTITSVATNKLSLTMTVTGQVGTGIYLGWNLYFQGEVGQAGGASYFINQSTVAGLGGQGGSNDVGGAYGGGYVGDGGGNGGQGSRAPNNPLSLSGGNVYRVGGGSGGSTAGYSGNGGNAGTDGSGFNPANPRNIILPTAGTGGGAGGSWNSTPTNFTGNNAQNYSFGAGSGGSGVGVYGEGSSGGYWRSSTLSYITSGPAAAYGATQGTVGQAGSGGGPVISGGNNPTGGDDNGYGAVGVYNSNTLQRGGDGGLYGGGGGSVGPQMIFDPDDRIGYGGRGAVRIIWGSSRNFPSTNTGDV
jgi:PKD repeat protein